MEDGVLLKLTIIPFEDGETVQSGPPAAPPFVAQFNPESFSVSTTLKLGPKEQAQGDAGGEVKFESVEPQTYSFDFLMDGTGASGPALDVLAQIELFKATTGFSGESHRPYFLVITWGSFLATCVLESFSISYTLFRPSGTPLRATLSAQFREHTPKTFMELTMNKSSPDVTHAWEVLAGEHLSLLTHRIYDDAAYYIDVAGVNGLDTVRALTPGATLYFPPLEQ